MTNTPARLRLSNGPLIGVAILSAMFVYLSFLPLAIVSAVTDRGPSLTHDVAFRQRGTCRRR